MSILSHIAAFLAGVIVCLLFTWFVMGCVIGGVASFGAADKPAEPSFWSKVKPWAMAQWKRAAGWVMGGIASFGRGK